MIKKIFVNIFVFNLFLAVVQSRYMFNEKKFIGKILVLIISLSVKLFSGLHISYTVYKWDDTMFKNTNFTGSSVRNFSKILLIINLKVAMDSGKWKIKLKRKHFL